MISPEFRLYHPCLVCFKEPPNWPLSERPSLLSRLIFLKWACPAPPPPAPRHFSDQSHPLASTTLLDKVQTPSPAALSSNMLLLDFVLHSSLPQPSPVTLGYSLAPKHSWFFVPLAFDQVSTLYPTFLYKLLNQVSGKHHFHPFLAGLPCFWSLV